MAEGRAPIKVGTGYIEVIPKVTQKAKTELRQELEKLGVSSAKGMSTAISQGLSGLPKEAAKQAKKAKKAIEEEAIDTKQALKRIEQQLTKEYGTETAKRFRKFRESELKKQGLLEETSAETRKALRDAVRVEEQSNRKRLASAERLENDRRKLTEKSRKDHEKAEQDKLKATKKRHQEELAEGQKQAKALLKRNKMLHDAYAENERRTRKEKQQTADAELKWNKMLERAYAENERRKRKEAAQTAREEQNWRRTVAQAYAENERRNQAAIRATAQAARAATQEQIRDIRRIAAERRADAQAAIADQQAIIRGLRTQMADTRRQITQTDSTTQNFLKRTEGGLRKMGTWFDQVGMSINETGNILVNRFLAPLAAAGAALATIGVKSADTRILGQFGLTAAGVSKGAATKQMMAIQQYAIDTPYSIDVMHEYQMRLIRAMAAANPDWFKGGPKRTAAADSAALKTTELIMAIGDSMARSGNLNPVEFQRAMYAIDKILDRDRAPTRNISQLVNATGIPAAELANLLGFSSSETFWKTVGKPAKDGGGVTGVEIVDALLKNWRGEGPREGSKGFAEQMTSMTISGRLQQLKERATFELGSLFAEEGKDGSYQYTKLGERLMGKKTPVFKQDKFGGQYIDGYTYEGGLLQQLEAIGQQYGPMIPKFLDLFFDGIQKFLDAITKIADFLNEHPEIKDAIAGFAKFLIEWGPLILAVGLMSKVLGKFTGLLGRALTPLSALLRGGINLFQGGRAAARQGIAANEAERTTRERLESERAARQAANGRGTFRERRRENRSINRQVRQAGRDAYRSERGRQRNGDTRSLGRRTFDGFMGRDSNMQDQQRRMRDFENQVREATEEIARLRRELREADQESMRQITQALAGNGQGSVQGAAGQASTAVGNIQTQAQQANNVSLDQLRQEVEAIEKAARNVVTELGKVKSDVTALDGLKLNQVTAEMTQLKAAAEEAGTKITSANTRVGNLDGKNVNQVTSSINNLTDAAQKAANQVGDGSMSQSASGRVANLNKRRLTEVIDEFRKLTDKADAAYQKVGMGTGSTSLAGRIGLLNGRSLKDITGRVDKLQGELNSAKKEAEGLDTALGNISTKSTGGGDGKNNGKNDRRARGGVIPGYQPWVDSVPAILSPGEAVLRPEVTSAIGEPTINAWNAMAIRGQLSRHARGGVAGSGGGRFDLDQVRELIELQNIHPIGQAMFRTLKMDGASDPLGGSVQGGILRTGDGSARFGGGAAAEKFRGMYDWMTEDMWGVLQKVPTLVGQAAGILGGTLSPIIGDYFWSDVWKGNGNIVDRGQRFMGHLFSLETLGKLWDNLYGGVSDSIGAIWSTVTDPVGALTNVVSDIGGIASGSYNNIIGMVETVKAIKDSPMGYAGRVFGQFMSTAQESMPNTKGLFDFDKGSKVNAEVPDFDKLLGAPAPGKGAEKWRLVAAQALQMLGLPGSALGTVLYRINMESGGNPNIVNKWDSNWKAGHPSVGLMQVIGPTYRAYSGPFGATGPFLYGTSVNPLANVYAGLNYARNRYGAGWQRMLAGNTGYASGTVSASPGFAMVGEKGRELVHFGGGERVFSNAETEALLNGKKYEIHVHEARNEPTPQAVMRALQTVEALYTTL
ncbi:hypothetical protein [Streptomyces wuyuanensis]|uniref:hypothetical protein n=1 Tax=Streptomyces wuyuanensis TaxID=1196353 RepID=UPI0034484385